MACQHYWACGSHNGRDVKTKTWRRWRVAAGADTEVATAVAQAMPRLGAGTRFAPPWVIAAFAMGLTACDAVNQLSGEGRCDTLSIVATRTTLIVGDSAILTARLRDASNRPVTCIGNNPASWSSSAPDVVRAEQNGLVRALTPGRATITARDGARSALISLMVQAAP